MVCHRLVIERHVTRQGEAVTSFVGGKPRLPADLPLPCCALCDSQQTFFFQVAFPPGHGWAGRSLALFACTACADGDHTIPPMLPGPLPGIDIPGGFLDAYQRNFRVLVFDTAAARVRDSYRELVAFKPWRLVPAQNGRTKRNKIGGEPNWLLEDESPGSYDGRVPMHFLLQLLHDVRFDTVAGAPPQARLYRIPGGPPRAHYNVFNANALYFFGTQDMEPPSVYIITQTD